ncbi:hypothetical protein [Magnetospirillum sp. ME-1]|uniref:hypothetical protein n=1 Tax=Magnetospirillum sp. ME-1 TaxID=1639348 RepID=UPI0011AE9BED|nr:hypothetical protein [Magnetospirillum sp. ME-1]
MRFDLKRPDEVRLFGTEDIWNPAEPGRRCEAPDPLDDRGAVHDHGWACCDRSAAGLSIHWADAERSSALRVRLEWYDKSSRWAGMEMRIVHAMQALRLEEDGLVMVGRKPMRAAMWRVPGHDTLMTTLERDYRLDVPVSASFDELAAIPDAEVLRDAFGSVVVDALARLRDGVPASAACGSPEKALRTIGALAGLAGCTGGEMEVPLPRPRRSLPYQGRGSLAGIAKDRTEAARKMIAKAVDILGYRPGAILSVPGDWESFRIVAPTLRFREGSAHEVLEEQLRIEEVKPFVAELASDPEMRALLEAALTKRLVDRILKQHA